MIKFLDLQKTNWQYQTEIEERLMKVFRSIWYLLGEEVANFEVDLKSYIKVDDLIGVATFRLILKGYKELGYMKDGDDVIVPSNTYIVSVLAISNNNLFPVFIEPDGTTLKKVKGCTCF